MQNPPNTTIHASRPPSGGGPKSGSAEAPCGCCCDGAFSTSAAASRCWRYCSWNCFSTSVEEAEEAPGIGDAIAAAVLETETRGEGDLVLLQSCTTVFVLRFRTSRPLYIYSSPSSRPHLQVLQTTDSKSSSLSRISSDGSESGLTVHRLNKEPMTHREPKDSIVFSPPGRARAYYELIGHKHSDPCRICSLLGSMLSIARVIKVSASPAF